MLGVTCKPLKAETKDRPSESESKTGLNVGGVKRVEGVTCKPLKAETKDRPSESESKTHECTERNTTRGTM